MENQFQILQPWIPLILSAIKKEIKTQHLPEHPIFYRAHFGNKPQNRLAAEEIFRAYEKELLGGDKELAEWVVDKWVLRHYDLYRHFAKKLKSIRPDFEALESLNEAESKQVLEGALEAFGAKTTYFFCILNGVVLCDATLSHLRRAAEQEQGK